MSEPTGDPSPEPAPATPELQPTPVLLRRAPRYAAFACSGAALGALTALAALVVVHGRRFDNPIVRLDVALLGALVGALLGAGVALRVERH